VGSVGSPSLRDFMAALLKSTQAELAEREELL
jgi:hypothetical protein